MKTFKTLVESLPSNTVVFAFGRFNPPTIGHELLIKAVKKVAATHKANHAIYVSRSQDKKKNPLDLETKLRFLKSMFSGSTFVGASDEVRTFIEAAKELNKKYKNLVMVAGSDRVPAYTELLNKYNGKEYNFDSISVISAGERDPDADDASGMSASKMRALAAKGQYHDTVEDGKKVSGFKSGLPPSVRDADGRQLMQAVRAGMGMSPVKEQIWLGTNTLREQYIKGEIFNVGDIVESHDVNYEIVERGTNYLRVVDTQGNFHRKWLHECRPVSVVVEDVGPGYPSAEISFKGYTTKNFHHAPEAAQAFHDTITRYGQSDPATVLYALKATDDYLKLNDMHLEQQKAPTEQEIAKWKAAHDKARDSLTRIQEFAHHFNYWHNHEHELQDMLVAYNVDTAGAEMADSYNPQGKLVEELTDKTIKASDRMKVARVIADMLGVEQAEKMSPAIAINTGLQRIKNKRMTPELIMVLRKMIALAKELEIDVNMALVPKAVSEAVQDLTPYPGIKKLMHPMASQEDNEGVEELEDPGSNRVKIGHTLHPSTDERDRTSRYMKIKYHTEQAEPGEKEEPAEKDEIPTADYKTTKSGKKYRAHKVVVEEADNELGFTEDDLDDIVNSVDHEDDILRLYDDDELSIVDLDSNKIVEGYDQGQLVEVLSRVERLRAHIRFMKTASKRARRLQIALHRHSDSKTINKRARRLAIMRIKERFAKKPVDQMTVAEKERVEKIIERNAPMVNRLALKLVPRIRAIEQERLTHAAVTKPAAAQGQ